MQHNGQLFARAVRRYERGRPGYPAAAIVWGIPDSATRVLDLGAGTGKLTADLIRPGRQVVAVDPSAEMLARLRRVVPGATTRVGTAEATGLPSARFDAVSVGAAFHWFPRPTADAEIARVLGPGGRVALLWNPIDPSDPLAVPLADLRHRKGMPEAEFDPEVVLDRRWFGPTERADFPERRRISVGEYLDQLATRSYVIALPNPERRQFLQEARERALAHAMDGSELEIGYRTTVLRADRAFGE
jgi:SAM-dependent methyltransferase